MFQHLLSHTPWLNVLVATIAYFVLGAIWYGPLFSKAWIRGHQINVNDPDAKKGVAGIMVASFVGFFIICLTLSIVLRANQVGNYVPAMEWGALLGIGFSASTHTISYLYLKKPLSIHLIDGAYHVIGTVLAAAVLIFMKHLMK